MRDIYSRAAAVRVWIDQEIDINSPAFPALPALNESSKREDLGEDPDVWAPIAKIIYNSYWDRLWVQQELVFAKDIVVTKILFPDYLGCFSMAQRSSY